MNLAQSLSSIGPFLSATKETREAIAFGEWMPDLPDLANPGATAANGVIPKQRSYGPLPGLSAQTDALDGRALGALAGTDPAGNVTIYAGDRSKLYALVAGAFADASKGGGYDTAVDGVWDFTQFGATVVAANYDDPVQSVAIGGTAFADLITSTRKPAARTVGIVRDHLVLGNTNDVTDGAITNRVWWSAINDPTDFDPDEATLCDFQDIPEGGWVQRIIGGVEYGTILMDRAIARMTFVGSPTIFQIDLIDRRRGTPVPQAAIGWGRLTFFLSEEGFFVNDGNSSTPIGANKVDRTFWNQFDVADRSRMSAAIDPVNKIVAWAFPGTGNVSGAPNKIYLYNWQDNRWSEADINTQIMVSSLSTGYTLDQLDQFGNLDALAYSLDSRAWTGGELQFAAFDTDNKLASFSGTNVAATLETAERQLSPGRSLVTSVRPLVDGGSPTVQVAGRTRQNDAESFGSAASLNTDGECRVRNNSRYHRFRVNVPAGSWDHAQGVEVAYSDVGLR